MRELCDNARIGVIGTGLLGGAMAARLLEQGTAVAGFDREPSRAEDLRARGGVVHESATPVFQSCPVVILSLPTSEVVHELIVHAASEIPRGTTIVDTTTGEPEQMTAIGGLLEQQGVAYVEATVAGSSTQARTGEVTLFLAGERTIVEHVEPVLSAITDRRFYLGDLGSASRFKLVHNLLLGLHRAVLAEGLTFAEALGFDAGRTLAILRQTPAASAVMDTKGPKMVDSDFEPQARLSQHLKDVRLIRSEAERIGAQVPLSALHQTLLDRAEQLGLGDSDNCAVIEAFRRQVCDG